MVVYRGGLPTQRRSPIPVLTGLDVEHFIDATNRACGRSVNGAEMGAERAENRVSGSAAVSGSYRNRYER